MRGLNVLANSWLPKASLSLEGELQESVFGREQVAPFGSIAPLTPPMTPTRGRPMQSSYSTPTFSQPKWTRAPPTPPSESTLRFVRSVLPEPERDDEREFALPPPAFDRAVGSPPRRSVQPQLPQSLPATPTAQMHLDTKAPAPWTWPRRGDAALFLDTPSTTTPSRTQSTLVAFDDLVGRSSSAGIGIRPDAVLATRYVRVDGLPHRLSQDDLKALFTVHYPGLKGFADENLRSHGTVVLAFHDVRDAIDALPLLRSTKLLTSPKPLDAACITRGQVFDLEGIKKKSLISKSEGVLVLSTRSERMLFSPADLLARCALRRIEIVDIKTAVVEFWDDREAEDACRHLDGQVVRGCRVACSFEPGVTVIDSVVKKAPARLSTPLRPQALPFHLPAPPQPFFAPRQPVPMLTPPASPVPVFQRPPLGSVINVAHHGSSLKSPVNVKSARRTPAAAVGLQQDAWRAPLATTGPKSFDPRTSMKSVPNPRAVAPDWGIYRDDKIPMKNCLILERIEKGLDVRTTLMIKNIPTRMTDVALMAYIDAAVGRCYDFLYLRMDFASEFNVGYGFVNFTSPSALLAFATSRLGTRWNSYHSDKLVVASYGNIQGKENLVTKFRNSAVMLECDEFRPKIFYTSGPKAGQPEPFPESDDPHRIARSAANVHNVGLFPAAKPVFKVGQALQCR